MSWEPTPEQLTKYLTREAELAKSNVCLMLRSQASTSGLLHSRETLHAAMQAVLAERPNRFARDPRPFSALPRPRREVVQ